MKSLEEAETKPAAYDTALTVTTTTVIQCDSSVFECQDYWGNIVNRNNVGFDNFDITSTYRLIPIRH